MVCLILRWMKKFRQKQTIAFAVVSALQMCVNRTLLSSHPHASILLYKWSLEFHLYLKKHVWIRNPWDSSDNLGHCICMEMAEQGSIGYAYLTNGNNSKTGHVLLAKFCSSIGVRHIPLNTKDLTLGLCALFLKVRLAWTKKNFQWMTARFLSSYYPFLFLRIHLRVQRHFIIVV